MRVRCSVFIATSLDGFIARSDGGIDWLIDANTLLPRGEDCGYGEFASTIDAIIMGRNTFEQALTFSSWPYGTTPLVVLSRSLTSLPPQTPATVSCSNESPGKLVVRLTASGCRRLYVDGGLTIQSFLQAGLIDDLTITTIPVLIGSGKRLFGELASDVHLELMSSRAFDFGFVQSTYRVK
jgi:dihydrofolate reductase